MFVNGVKASANLYASNAFVSNRYANSAIGSRNIQKRDELSLSEQAQSFSAILQELREQSEVRQTKVDELEKQVSSGNYNISSDAIALSMLTSRF